MQPLDICCIVIWFCVYELKENPFLAYEPNLPCRKWFKDWIQIHSEVQIFGKWEIKDEKGKEEKEEV